MAYLYADCLIRMDSDHESVEIIQNLARNGFPPALVTMGDGCLTYNEIDERLEPRLYLQSNRRRIYYDDWAS